MSTRARRPRPSNVAVTRSGFPWATTLGAAGMTLALGGVLGYAVLNQGEGFVDPLEKADDIQGVAVSTSEEIGDAGHVETPVDYGTQPPVGGKMSGTPEPCTVFTQPARTQGVVHSMEHGGVWFTYRPDLDKAQVAQLTDLAEGKRSLLLSPFPGLDAPITAQAWGRRLKVDRADDPRLEQFAKSYANGPQSPERGMGC